MRWGRIALLAAVSSCGVFSSSEEPPVAEDPSVPPIEGTPVTGVFVSDSKGADDLGDGSRERPFKTIKAGIARAKDLNQRVIVCAERYAEKVDLVDGVSLYGAYACDADWAPSEGKAEISSPEERGLVAIGIARSTRVDGFTIRSADLGEGIADARKRSSYGVYIRDSKNILFVDVTIVGGRGGDGTDGQIGENNVERGSPTGRNGSPQTTVCPFSGAEFAFCGTALTLGGSLGGTSQCKEGASGPPGGQGGNGNHEPNLSWDTPSQDFRGRPFAATPVTAQGGIAWVSAGSGGGTPGGVGIHGDNGDPGLAHFDADGFVAGDGKKAGPGGPGQGGGGGGGNLGWRNASGTLVGLPPDNISYPTATGYWTATGAGGGAGGCGGLPGEPGSGGGASIGIFVANSVIRIEASTVRGGTGGRAGVGSVGHVGLAGGSPGLAAAFGGGGGRGGDGGASGISGAGAPGPSIALVFLGDRPTLDRVELTPGEGGAGVPAISKPVANGTRTVPAVTPGTAEAERQIL